MLWRLDQRKRSHLREISPRCARRNDRGARGWAVIGAEILSFPRAGLARCASPRRPQRPPFRLFRAKRKSPFIVPKNRPPESVWPKINPIRSARNPYLLMSANMPLVRAHKSAGASSISRPRRPALTNMVAKAWAEASITVVSFLFCPKGLIPPST